MVSAMNGIPRKKIIYYRRVIGERYHATLGMARKLRQAWIVRGESPRLIVA